MNFRGSSNNVVAPLELTSALTGSAAHRLGTTAEILSNLTLTLRITMFNVQTFYALFTEFIYVCSVVSIYICNWLVFLRGSEFVYCVTKTVFLNIIQLNLSRERVKWRDCRAESGLSGMIILELIIDKRDVICSGFTSFIMCGSVTAIMYSDRQNTWEFLDNLRDYKL